MIQTAGHETTVQIDLDDVALFHFPGINIGNSLGYPLGPGLLTHVPFDVWSTLDREQPYARGQYEGAAPVFLAFTANLLRPSRGELKQIARLLHASLCLATSVPLPSPSLSVAYFEGGSLSSIGSCGRNWLLSPTHNPLLITQELINNANDNFKTLIAARETADWQTILVALDTLTLIGLPDALYSLGAINQVRETSNINHAKFSNIKIEVENFSTSIGGALKIRNMFAQLPAMENLTTGLVDVNLENAFVLSVSTVEGVVASDVAKKPADATLSEWFSTCTHAFLKERLCESPFSLDQLRDLYSLRSKLVHGQLKKHQYRPSASEITAMRLGFQLLTTFIVALASRPETSERKSTHGAGGSGLLIPILAGASVTLQKIVNEEWEMQPEMFVDRLSTPPDLTNDNYIRSVCPFWGLDLIENRPIALSPTAMLFKPTPDLWWWRFAEPELRTLFMDWNAPEMMKHAPTLLFLKHPIAGNRYDGIPCPGTGSHGQHLKEMCQNATLSLRLTGFDKFIDPSLCEQIYWWDLLFVRHYGAYRGVAYDGDVQARRVVERPQLLPSKGEASIRLVKLYALASIYSLCSRNTSADIAIRNFLSSQGLQLNKSQRLATLFTALDVMLAGMNATRIGNYKMSRKFCDRLTNGLLLAAGSSVDAGSLANKVDSVGRNIRNSIAHGRMIEHDATADEVLELMLRVLRLIIPLYLSVAIVQATAPSGLRTPLIHYASMPLAALFNRLLCELGEPGVDVEAVRNEIEAVVDSASVSVHRMGKNEQESEEVIERMLHLEFLKFQRHFRDIRPPAR